MPIVGVGASAGGLEAFEQFFRAMPGDTGMGFVLVQHLDPTHGSMLVEILQRASKMPVVEATDRMPVEPNRVHVIPPNRDMVIVGGSLRLSLPAQPHGLRMPIDAFLRSLADDRGDAAIGIVLSGTGTDGTLGLRAIRGAGGLCLVQDPASAKYDGMPNSAIGAGYASLVARPDEMPPLLARGSKPGLPVMAQPGGPLDKILGQLRKSTGHDFALYKKSTVGRRVERRMVLNHIEDPAAYVGYLDQHPEETRALFQELLINVTSFFRDPEAFTALESKVLPALLEHKPDGEALRIWIVGCATGEEVYSVAIVVREWIEKSGRDLKVQLYATDIDEDAIKFARAGIYPVNVAQDLSPERLRRFFVKEEAGYRIRKEIREMAVFALQSVIKDPPFTRLDLLCCRNVLIYFELELQNLVFPIFHYALRPGGVLFLSPSESVGTHTDLFEVFDRRWKFYRAKVGATSTRKLLGGKLSWTAQDTAVTEPAAVGGGSERHLAEIAQRALLQSFAPAAVVTDLQGETLFVHGDTGRFLRLAPGHPSRNVVELAREGLEFELRSAIQLAASKRVLVIRHPVILGEDGAQRTIDLSVSPLPDAEAGRDFLLVSFQEQPVPAPKEPPSQAGRKRSPLAQRCDELQRELTSAKNSMRSLVEQQQASNEELKSTNEELQSANEELQSTNEELETSREELQSVNEELVTVNVELQTRIDQMAGMQDDMKNLLENLRLGTIFLDRNLAIRRFTQAATKIYPLVAADVGRPLANFRSVLQDCDLLGDCQVVLDSLVPTEREARTATGTWYLARVQPYRTTDNLVDGVVLTFADVTERVNALAAQEARRLAESIVDAVASPLAVLDSNCKVVSANRTFRERFQSDAGELAGRRLFDIAEGRWELPAVHQLLEAEWAPGLEHRRAEVAGVEIEVRRIAAQPGGDTLYLMSIDPGHASAQVAKPKA